MRLAFALIHPRSGSPHHLFITFSLSSSSALRWCTCRACNIASPEETVSECRGHSISSSASLRPKWHDLASLPLPYVTPDHLLSVLQLPMEVGVSDVHGGGERTGGEWGGWEQGFSIIIES